MLLPAGLRPRCDSADDGGEVVRLDDQMADPVADLHWPVGWPVDQFGVTTCSPGNLSIVRLAPSPMPTRPTSRYPSAE